MVLDQELGKVVMQHEQETCDATVEVLDNRRFFSRQKLPEVVKQCVEQLHEELPATVGASVSAKTCWNKKPVSEQGEPGVCEAREVSRLHNL